LHAVVEMAEDRMPREHAPMPARMRANGPDPRDDPLVQQGEASKLRRMVTAARPAWLQRLGVKTASLLPFKRKAARARTPPSSKDVVIDVMVAYTRKAAGNYVAVKRDLIDLAIEEANESFRISKLGHIKLKLVHAYETDYVEQGEHFEHLYRMVDRRDGYMEEVHGLREKHRADVVVLVVDDPAGCGLATRVHAEADEAFAVVHHECAASSYSMAHEIGHIIGARHDRNLDKTTTPFPYGHGYVNGTKWRDIMSYKESCNGCPRVPVWSSPNVLVKGEPAGAPDLDNARVIMEQAARVAGFR
ncbi:MAG TPA: M12 family metallo-peptidase, partial [Hyphomicrobiaceae bacterium]|nr:M12 family metallo-peptidase [Hyphomicrobiaceae bacterium]